MLVGTEEGHIFLGAIAVENSGKAEVAGPFKQVMQIPEYSAILDIKCNQVKDVFLCLAVSATSLYQFVGRQSLEETFKAYMKPGSRLV